MMVASHDILVDRNLQVVSALDCIEHQFCDRAILAFGVLIRDES